MQLTSDNHATARRSALRGSLAVIAASLTVPRPARAAAPDDTELIALCDRLAALRDDEMRASIDDEEVDDYAEAEWWRISERIMAIGAPITIDGARAMARAAVPHINRGPDGDLVFCHIAEVLSTRVCEFLAAKVVT